MLSVAGPYRLLVDRRGSQVLGYAEGSGPSGGCAAAVRSALAYWHPAAVVADTRPAAPLGRFLSGLLGRPAARDGGLLAWRVTSLADTAR